MNTVCLRFHFVLFYLVPFCSLPLSRTFNVPILHFYILLNYYAGLCDYFCLTQGSSSTEIVFEVTADGAPELAEEYLLSLTAVETLSEDISELGRAQLDSDATVATITLRASDNPHGVVEFQELSVEAESSESSPVVLTIVREFGSIGKHFTLHSVCEVSCFIVYSVKYHRIL